MANLVGPQFYAAFTDLCVLRNMTEPPGELGGVYWPSADLKFFETTFLKMHQKIFLDLAWQHEAFQTGGLDEINRLAEAGAFGKRKRIMMEAWANIATGDPQLVAKGNKVLLQREQQDVIQKDYDSIRRRDWPVGKTFTWFLSRNAGDPTPIPGNKPFRNTVAVSTVPDMTPDWAPERLIPGKDGDVSKFRDRWKWIEKDMLPAYNRLLKERPDEMAKTVDSPLSKRAARFRRFSGQCKG